MALSADATRPTGNTTRRCFPSSSRTNHIGYYTSDYARRHGLQADLGLASGVTALVDDMRTDTRTAARVYVRRVARRGAHGHTAAVRLRLGAAGLGAAVCEPREGKSGSGCSVYCIVRYKETRLCFLRVKPGLDIANELII